MIVNTQSKRCVLLMSAALALCMGTVQAQDSKVNEFAVKSQLYIWNRFADLLETVRGGIAVGPAIGAEFAVTERAAFGAYATNEVGTSFPHFIPPLWLVPYYEQATVLRPHRGVYWTRTFGRERKENVIDQDVRFARDPLDVRAQLALGLVHVYGAVKTEEVYDFVAGFAGLDPKLDDEKLDPTARREPVAQFGRGLTNAAFGWMELPKNMIRVNREEGDMAGATKGLGHGVWRSSVRTGVGLVELVSFPFGWEPIVEPVYVLQPAYTTEWDINKLPFGSKY